jgi:hypothetical protein
MPYTFSPDEVAWLLHHFPRLITEPYRPIEGPGSHYNCIAWSAGLTNINWWPDRNPPVNWEWPSYAPADRTIRSFFILYAAHHYRLCANGEHESGMEKIAIYGSSSIVTHAARQLVDGAWTSKLGGGPLLSHTLYGLTSNASGAGYGSVLAFMSRPSVTTASGAASPPA